MTTYSNRYKRVFPVVRLPKEDVVQDRGLDECCCKFLVWGSPETDNYKRMVNSLWIRDVTEWRFYLVKHSTGMEYEIEAQAFVFDTSARYATVDWSTILSEYGAGCYTFKVDYTINGGITGTKTKGEFDLIPYDLRRIKDYVMFRTTFNRLNTEENIQFRGSNVVDCIAFKGRFGEADPNTQIENLLYNSRLIEPAWRENAYVYELLSDPLQRRLTKPILDLHLLHENEIVISEFNPMSHAQYLDTPCIVEEVGKPEYVGNLAKINAKFGDKKKDKRSRYGR